jgi:glucan 1,3-beta-glucosidase
MRLPFATLALWATAALQPVSAYWMEDVAHRGVSPFNPDKSYQVFRNVKDFGAKGDGGMSLPKNGFVPKQSNALT